MSLDRYMETKGLRSDNLRSVVVGMGEVGKALEKMTGATELYDTSWDLSVYELGRQVRSSGLPYVLHICFPYHPDFEIQVQTYRQLFLPKYTIIHSTVPVGTSRMCHALHSPVRGLHPNLDQGMRDFVTYLAPRNQIYDDLFHYLDSCGFNLRLVDKAEETEAGKLWSLAAYAVMITLEKEIWEFCRAHNLDFDVVYKDFTETYNEGYNKLDRPEFIRPVLKHVPGPIGGHCVIPGTQLIQTDDHYEGGLLSRVLMKDFFSQHGIDHLL